MQICSQPLSNCFVVLVLVMIAAAAGPYQVAVANEAENETRPSEKSGMILSDDQVTAFAALGSKEFRRSIPTNLRM